MSSGITCSSSHMLPPENSVLVWKRPSGQDLTVLVRSAYAEHSRVVLQDLSLYILDRAPRVICYDEHQPKWVTDDGALVPLCPE
jgi:hypothetical protein